MAIATGTALLASAALGAAGSIYGASKGAKAAQQAGQLEYKAAQEANALNEKIYNQTRADNEWQRQLGMSAGSAISSGFGLSSPMTGGSVNYAAPVATGGQPDYAAYLSANPDVAAAYQSEANRDAKSQANLRALGIDSPEEFAAYHYANNGQAEGRTLATTPVVQPQAQQPTMTGQQSGYVDPTATGGYTSPNRPTMAPLDVSAAAFKESPGYQFSLTQGNKALGNITSANRGLMSGQRLKAASEYNVGMADQEFGNWRDYTTNQYNNDRNYGEAVYQSDRSRLDDRYDTRNGQLLTLAGFGQSANAANQNAAQSFANNSANLSMTGARAQGDAKVNAANAWGGAFNNIMTSGAYLAGQYGGGGSGGGSNGGGSRPSWSIPYA